jgi:deoxyribodipyrimidine photolyase-related protein
MLKQHDVPGMEAAFTGKWNYDSENREKFPKNHKPTAPLVF